MRPLLLLRSAITTLALLAASALPAQDDSLLILDEDKSEVQVKTKPKEEKTPEPASAAAPAPTPNPSDVLVAIVNSQVLTRADLDARVDSRFEGIRKEIQERRGGVVAKMGPGQAQIPASAMETEDYLMLDEQKTELEAAIRREEREAVRLWVDHRLLADEARRQRIAVTEQEFRDRLASAERASNLTKERIDEVLTGLRMSRQDYEASVYDALLIEKLLKQFIDLNYDEAYLRARYDENPSTYHEAEKHLVAHFSIVLGGDESKDRLKELRGLADEVQERLAKGEDPAKVFAREKYSRIDQGIWGMEPTWFYLDAGGLPPVVNAELKKMQVGETSNVLEQRRRVGTEVRPDSFHVIKYVDHQPATGETFESAMPTIQRALIEVAKIRLAERLRESKTHRVIVNLSGIPAKKIPTAEEARNFESKAEAISLRLPPGVPASPASTPAPPAKKSPG